MPSGGGGGDSVDREYNARMATIAEKQQAMAEEYFQYWKSGPGHWETRPADYAGSSSSGIRSAFDSLVPKTEKVWVKDEGGVSYMDMEQAQMKSNMELIPKQTKYMSTSLDAETGLVPQRAGLESAFLNAETGLVPQRAGLESAFLNAETRLVPQRASLESASLDAETRLVPQRAGLESTFLDAETRLVPQRAGLESAFLDAETRLVPQRAGLESTFLDAETGLVPQRASLESALIAEQQENIALRKPVTSKFYDEVLKGVDVDERVNLARADVESAYAGAESNARRWASGMGINPASKSYSAGLMSLAKEKAAAKVGATSLARRQAEEENFARLSSAVGLGSA